MAVRVPPVMRRIRSATRGRPRLPARLNPRRARIFAVLGLLGPGLIAANAGNDAGGIATFLNLFAHGATAEDVQAAIMGSAEFANRSDGSDSGFVGALYQDLLNRPVDAAGLATFTGQLATGTTRSASRRNPCNRAFAGVSVTVVR